MEGAHCWRPGLPRSWAGPSFALAVGTALMLLAGAERACASGPGASASANANAKARAKAEAFFEQNVRPLLAENCLRCHASKKHKGGLRLDSRASVLRGGDSGPAVVPGRPEESLLIDAVHYEGPEMPPTGPLDARKIAVLERWVAMGAPWPKDGPAKRAVGSSIDDGPPLWSLQPVQDPPVPELSAETNARWPEWTRNPIDRFVLKGLLDRGLAPAEKAGRAALVRRLSFDLIGLPPSPEEIDAFLNDRAPGAYERLVDRLLASPRHGERWARHWLDLVRYAESDGYNQDAHRPDAWRYRAYVVRSFNRDKPYDRFLTEQLAGDELDPNDPELRVATGYFRLGPYEYNQRDVRGQWSDTLNEITDVTGEVFLGLSIGCARCHDHKFDPILRKDYYRLQAFFAPILPRNDLTAAGPSEWRAYQARRSSWEATAAPVLKRMAAVERPYREKAVRAAIEKFPEDIQAILNKPLEKRSPLERQLGAMAYRQVSLEKELTDQRMSKGPRKAEWSKLEKALARFDGLKPAAPGALLTVTDVGPLAPTTTIPGDPRHAPIAPGFLSALDPAPARVAPPPAAARSTGRRLALARWLVRPDNPLSARVVVNRIWQYHFGRGLVGTSGDFGRLGDRPSHPELLDWLARRFVAEGWRWKPIHRLIVGSAAYRQAAVVSARARAEGARIDPENRLLWKRTVQRLDGDEVRDAMLAVSGELAPSFNRPDAPLARLRRSVETSAMRNHPAPLLLAFDVPDGNGVTALRDVTTTSTQALLLINGEWSLARARAFAARLERSDPGQGPEADGARLRRAYRLALGRSPTPEEIAGAVAFLDRQAGLADGTNSSRAHEALADFCHVLLNSNEFVYID